MSAWAWWREAKLLDIIIIHTYIHEIITKLLKCISSGEAPLDATKPDYWQQRPEALEKS